ncbi:penicillin-binding protein [Lysinibacillus sp. KCTC 33748]|uniref:penicillin-binding transpeptidase domain-containing protein n=1 Tax=unclassified Lysinibacillus TaxID=2636778 RepID=UPI0009A79270|nr:MULTISPECIES: penicillin-binding transpeptidase domain-containing protein [unclassified Lysinibacillus]OXS77312.1 penicillin-binding protein [Lysinibacillus sp. KCTC 33748]SKB33152.1 penicillin-binding protein 2B [Lysinibacillus sp. AC-3]
MKKKRFRFQWGAFLLFIFYGGLFFLLFTRMVTLQATGEVKGQELAAKAAAKYSKESVITANRGKIFDAKGQIIAEDTLSYRLIAIVNKEATTNSKKPRHVVDPDKTAKILAEYIPMDEKKIYQQLTRVKDDGEKPYQVEFGGAGRGLSHETMSKIKEENLPGILFVNDLKRYYPNGIFASHLIGFALKEENKDGTLTTKGKMGLELTYNKELTGKDGKVEYETDAFSYLLPNSEKMVTPAENGDDIYLTLDKTIQSFLEEKMTEVEKEYNPEAMTAIIARPKTGEILAMSQRPTFNPDTREGDNMKWLNEAIEETIEPGSTMKTFTLASAIDTGAWDPNAYYPSGQYRVHDRVIKDYNKVGWGYITYLQGFQRSSNTAMAHLLKLIGEEEFFEYLDRFGFGKKTGIDLPNEASGKLLSNYPVERVTTTFGQGSTVTPIQLIQALTAIANDGKMMQPYVIDRIVDPSTGKTIKKHEPVVKGKPVSADTAKQVKEILASTLTAEKGSATDFVLDEYEVAGKTGTAQIPLGNGRYSWGSNEFLYSFLGMAPVDDPQLIMYVSIKRPKLKGEAGSIPVSKVFNPVMLNSLKYLNVNPEDVKQVDDTKIQDYTGQSAEAIQVELQNDGLQPIIVGGGGKIIDQYPKGPQKLVKGNFVFLKTAGDVVLPDFTNWSLRNVLAFKALAELELEVVGEGFVASQSISAGTVISDRSPIVVKLKTPAESFIKDVEAPTEGETE